MRWQCCLPRTSSAAANRRRHQRITVKAQIMERDFPLERTLLIGVLFLVSLVFNLLSYLLSQRDPHRILDPVIQGQRDRDEAVGRITHVFEVGRQLVGEDIHVVSQDYGPRQEVGQHQL